MENRRIDTSSSVYSSRPRWSRFPESKSKKSFAPISTFEDLWCMELRPLLRSEAGPLSKIESIKGPLNSSEEVLDYVKSRLRSLWDEMNRSSSKNLTFKENQQVQALLDNTVRQFISMGRRLPGQFPIDLRAESDGVIACVVTDFEKVRGKLLAVLASQSPRLPRCFLSHASLQVAQLLAYLEKCVSEGVTTTHQHRWQVLIHFTLRVAGGRDIRKKLRCLPVGQLASLLAAYIRRSLHDMLESPRPIILAELEQFASLLIRSSTNYSYGRGRDLPRIRALFRHVLDLIEIENDGLCFLAFWLAFSSYPKFQSRRAKWADYLLDLWRGVIRRRFLSQRIYALEKYSTFPFVPSRGSPNQAWLGLVSRMADSILASTIYKAILRPEVSFHNITLSMGLLSEEFLAPITLKDAQYYHLPLIPVGPLFLGQEFANWRPPLPIPPLQSLAASFAGIEIRK